MARREDKELDKLMKESSKKLDKEIQSHQRKNRDKIKGSMKEEFEQPY